MKILSSRGAGLGQAPTTAARGHDGEDPREDDALLGSRDGSGTDTLPHQTANSIFTEKSVHGQHLSWASAYILIVSRMIGSSVFASPGVVMQAAGSIGLSLCIWMLGVFIVACGASVSMEYGCMLPRSGGEKVYLEYVYRRPKYLMSTIVVVRSVLQTATANNCIIFGEYLMVGLPVTPSSLNRKLSALGLLLFVTTLHGFFWKTGILVQNILGWTKLAFMMVLVPTAGFVLVSGFLWGNGQQRKEKPVLSHQDSWKLIWEGSNWNWGMCTWGLFRVYYAFAGLDNANMVLNEVDEPVGMLKRNVPLSLLSTTLLYLLINGAYFMVLPSEMIKNRGELAAIDFFAAVWGEKVGATILPLLVAFFIAGNVMTAVFSLSRLNQEIARHGFLPLAIATSPQRAIWVNVSAAFLYILLLPSSNVYALLIDAEAYAAQIFAVALVCGLIWLRVKRPDLKRPFKAWHSVIAIHLCACLILLAAPLYPSAKSAAEDTLGLPHAIYTAFGLCIIFGATVYWATWAKLLPWLRGQTLYEYTGILRNGTSFTRIVGVPRH